MPDRGERISTRALRRLTYTPLLGLAWLIVAVVMLMAIAGPWFCPHDSVHTDLSLGLAPPS